MGKTFFGITIPEGWPEYDYQDICARLFMSKELSAGMCIHLLEKLTSGDTSLHTFMDLTDKFISNTCRDRDILRIFSKEMQERYSAWCREIGPFSMEDFKHLETSHGIPRKHLVPGDFKEGSDMHIRSPRHLSQLIRRKIKGQDEAIDKISVAVYQHYLNVKFGYSYKTKCPLLSIGPTGCGKTKTFQVACEICGLTLVTINSSHMVPTGWKGETFMDIIRNLIKSGLSAEQIGNAIFLFDEFDKVARNGVGSSTTSSAEYKYDMMRELMRIVVPDHTITIDMGPMDENTVHNISTARILFVFAGVFAGLEDIILKRLSGPKAIGFSQSKQKQSCGTGDETMKRVIAQDLVEYGFMEELISRIGNNYAVFNTLTKENFREILAESDENDIQMAIEDAAQYNTELSFNQDAMTLIADKAYESRLGARHIKSLVQVVLAEVQQEIICLDGMKQPHRIITIDREYVSKKICG